MHELCQINGTKYILKSRQRTLSAAGMGPSTANFRSSPSVKRGPTLRPTEPPRAVEVTGGVSHPTTCTGVASQIVDLVESQAQDFSNPDVSLISSLVFLSPLETSNAFFFL